MADYITSMTVWFSNLLTTMKDTLYKTEETPSSPYIDKLAQINLTVRENVRALMRGGVSLEAINNSVQLTGYFNDRRERVAENQSIGRCQLRWSYEAETDALAAVYTYAWRLPMASPHGVLTAQWTPVTAVDFNRICKKQQ